MTVRTAEDIVRRAAAAFNDGRPDDARRQCEEGLARWPNQPMLNHLLAAVHFAQGDLDAARNCIDASLRIAPEHGPARLLAARIARRSADYTRALAHLDRLDGSIRPEILLERARTLDHLDAPADALAAWRRVLRAMPESTEAAARIGRLCWEAGDLPEAAAVLERAVLGDCSATTWFDLGLVRQDLGDNRGAETAYRRALSIAPDYVEAAINLGIVRQEAGDIDSAIAAYRTAYRLRPSTFGSIAMALTSLPTGQLWLNADALRQLLGL